MQVEILPALLFLKLNIMARTKIDITGQLIDQFFNQLSGTKNKKLFGMGEFWDDYSTSQIKNRMILLRQADNMHVTTGCTLVEALNKAHMDW